MRRLLTVAEALELQRRDYGRVALGRDALYAAVRSRRLAVVRVGRRRLYIPQHALQQLLDGALDAARD